MSHRLLAALFTLAAATVQAQPATTLMQLLDALPAPPATPQEAAQWLNAEGRLAHPGLMAQRQATEAHRSAMGRIAASDAAAARTQAGHQTESLAKGMADIGIDMQRMQSDPAYAAQMQQRIARMSPAEQMALAQRMQAPMQQDRRLTNEAQAMASDSPAARAAYEAGQAYAQAAAFNARRSREIKLWQDAEAAIMRLNSRKLEPGLPRPGMEYDNIGCQAACRAQWEAYADRMLPLMLARETEALKLRSAAWQKQRAWAAAELKPINQQLAATGYGTQSTSRVHREQILAYDQSAVGEVQALYERLVDTVGRAATVVRCGPQAVLVPGVACS